MNIKKHFLGLLASTVIAASAGAADFNIDPEHSFVQFKVKHLGYSWLIGSFNEVSGTLTTDADSSKNTVSINVSTKSLDTNHKVRDGHLSNKGIINNADFAEASFVSTSYKGDEKGGLLTGLLSINGEQQEVSLEVNHIGEGDDPWGGYRTGFEGELSIDRRQFGSDKNFGPASWDVVIEVYIEAIKQG